MYDWAILKDHLPLPLLSLPPFTGKMLIVHLIGDYILQSEWMAYEKTRKTYVALIHGLFYTLPFALFFGPTVQALAVICLTHVLIDRFRLARFVCYLKNFLAPPKSMIQIEESTSNVSGSIHVKQTRLRTFKWWRSWADCNVTGYPNDTKEWITIWLTIIADGLMHVVINAYALHLL